ncbi:MAG: hypothetical protein ACRDR6_27470 [Pseudonocardiaceae bacterium]
MQLYDQDIHTKPPGRAALTNIARHPVSGNPVAKVIHNFGRPELALLRMIENTTGRPPGGHGAAPQAQGLRA